MHGSAKMHGSAEMHGSAKMHGCAELHGSAKLHGCIEIHKSCKNASCKTARFGGTSGVQPLYMDKQVFKQFQAEN